MPTDETSVAAYSYSSQPHSAPAGKKSGGGKQLYREKEEKGNVFPLTVMADPRIVRGNTHSLAKKISLQTQMEIKDSLNSNKEKVPIKTETNRPTFRYDVKPFSNNEIDVSQYLTEIPDRIVTKAEVTSQTDQFKERPITPPYIPRKTGVDRSTQVEDVRELFSFDKEVKSMLEVLVTKTLQSALFEVQCESELLSLQSAAEEFQKTMAIEDDWMREKQLQDAKEQQRVKERLQELEAAKKAALNTKENIAALQMMRQTLAKEQVEQIITRLYATGAWELGSKTAARLKLMPAVVSNAVKSVDAKRVAHIVADELLLSAEQSFYELPSPSPPVLGRHLLHVIYRRPLPPVEPVVGEEGGDPETITTSPVRMSTTLRQTYSIGLQDSILTMETRIKGDIYDAKATLAEAAAVAAAAAEGGEAAASQPGESSTELTLSQVRASLISSQLLAARFNESLAVPIALDAPLLNFFSITKDLSFEVQIEVE